jgi:hypothetical protein
MDIKFHTRVAEPDESSQLPPRQSSPTIHRRTVAQVVLYKPPFSSRHGQSSLQPQSQLGQRAAIVQFHLRKEVQETGTEGQKVVGSWGDEADVRALCRRLCYCGVLWFSKLAEQCAA